LHYYLCRYNTIQCKQVLEQTCHLSHLSVGWSVCPSVCPVGELWKNGGLDLDAILGPEWGQSRDGCIRWGGDCQREVAGLGVNVGHFIVTSEEFVA